MPAVWTEADLLERGFRPDGSRVPAPLATPGGHGGGLAAASEMRAPPADPKSGCPAETSKPGRQGEREVPANGQQPRRSKYGAIRTEGIGPNGERRVFDSRRECERARQLAMLKSAGVIEDWFPQIPIPYGEHKNGRPAKTIVDFMVVHEYLPDGRMLVEFEDAKGFHDKASQARYAALRARGFRITLR